MQCRPLYEYTFEWWRVSRVCVSASGRHTEQTACREASLTCDGDGRRAVCRWRCSGSRAQRASSSARPPPPSLKWASAERSHSARPTGCGEASAAGHCARDSPHQVPAPIADEARPAGAQAPASTPASAGVAHDGLWNPLPPQAQICCSNWLRSRCLMSTSQ